MNAETSVVSYRLYLPWPASPRTPTRTLPVQTKGWTSRSRLRGVVGIAVSVLQSGLADCLPGWTLDLRYRQPCLQPSFLAGPWTHTIGSLVPGSLPQEHLPPLSGWTVDLVQYPRLGPLVDCDPTTTLALSGCGSAPLLGVLVVSACLSWGSCKLLAHPSLRQNVSVSFLDAA